MTAYCASKWALEALTEGLAAELKTFNVRVALVEPGIIDTSYVSAIARAHEYAGFDRALIGYFSSAPDGFQVAAYAAHQTERLNLLLAHRPGFVAPGYVYGAPTSFGSYRTFPVVYGTGLTTDQIAPPPPIGVYAPALGPGIGLYGR